MSALTDDHAHDIASGLINFLETGEVREGLFAPDVFCDYSPPLWRLQASGREDVIQLRRNGHPSKSKVTRSRLDSTASGFVLELEERWEQDGKAWYARQMIRADVAGGAIASLAVYCTGDWTAERCSQHAREVRLLRP